MVNLVSLGKTAVEAGPAAAAPSSLVMDVKAYLHFSFQEPLALDGLAARFYVSKAHLCRAFKAQMGRTLTQYVNDLKVARAAALLQAGRGVAQARDEAGFSSSQHFISQFKARKGQTPGQYRRAFLLRQGAVEGPAPADG